MIKMAKLVLTVIILWLQVRSCLCLNTFVFGDSLVDAGNNDYLFTLSKADMPPYGIDFKPSGGQPTGRFTNGRTISDILDELLGGISYPRPYLAPNTQSDGILRGMNYASGSAGILDETGSFFIGRVPLREQVNYFEISRDEMVKRIGENSTKELLKKAIFSITIGSNDILNYIQPSIPFLANPKVSPFIFQDFMLSNFSMHLKRLHELGARKFVVSGVGPLGCIPIVRALDLLLLPGQCSLQANEITRGYNNKLKKLLARLNQETHPESIFVYTNSYDIFMNIITNYRHYGFDDWKGACCGGNLPPFVCFNTNNLTQSCLCNDRNKYVFWDGYHPTEAANIIVAKQFLEGGPRAASPMNVRQLYSL